MSKEQLASIVPDARKRQVIEMLSGNGNRVDAIPALIKETVSASSTLRNMDQIKALCLATYESEVPLAAARSVLAQLVLSMTSMRDDSFFNVATFLLAVHQLPNNPRSFTLEPMLVPIRERLSVIYEQKNEWFLAAEILTRIPAETLAALPDQGFSFNVRIAHLFIAAKMVDRADYHLSRATTHLNLCDDDALRLQHRICHARILDLKGKFEDAAHRYYVLVNDLQSAHIVDSMTDTQVPALFHAVTCAILAPAGPRRSRLLSMLYNDERSQRLDIYPLLESIYMGRLLCKEQVDRFRPTLQPHQLSSRFDGDTVLDRAIIEHNLIAVSRMYTNIGLNELGVLLNVSSERAEKTGRVMINEKRLNASIDQVEHIVNFNSPNSSLNIDYWDAVIASLCGQVDDCVEAIVDKFPSFTTRFYA